MRAAAAVPEQRRAHSVAATTSSPAAASGSGAGVPAAGDHSPARRLVVIRHAEATHSVKFSDRDAARPLTRRGKRQAQRLAEALSARGRAWLPDLVLVSPAVRTAATWRAISEGWPALQERIAANSVRVVTTDESLYLISVTALRV